MSIVYATSFTEAMYGSTGKECLKSFKDKETFYIYGEGSQEFLEDLEIWHGWDSNSFDIMQNQMLIEWLETNKDIIPTACGGEFKCKCPKSGKRFNRGHTDACAGGGFRGRASHWFRKFAAICDACERAESEGTDVVVWVDSDIVFQQPTTEFVESKLGNYDIMYHMGPTRVRADVGTETGFLVINLAANEHAIIEEMRRRFMDGTFRKYKRWDEAWMLWEVLKSGKYNGYDVVEFATPTGHVVEAGLFCKHITHNKGIHWKEGVV